MRVTSKGQVTIPAEIRDLVGFQPETEVEFHMDGDIVFITKVKNAARATRGSKLIARLRGKGDVAMSTDEIMALTRGE